MYLTHHRGKQRACNKTPKPILRVCMCVHVRVGARTCVRHTWRQEVNLECHLSDLVVETGPLLGLEPDDYTRLGSKPQGSICLHLS